MPHQFEDCIYRECKIKRQIIYNYRNLYKLLSVAPNLLNCWVNMTYFVQNYEVLIGFFEENEEQIPWKHYVYCACETCISYFSEE